MGSRSMLVNMTKNVVKPRNIFLTINEHNKKNVRYVYRKLDWGHRTDATIDDVTWVKHVYLLV